MLRLIGIMGSVVLCAAAAWSASGERHGKEIFLPFCEHLPAPFYSGFIPGNLTPFDSDATLLVKPSDSTDSTMRFGGKVEVNDVFADTNGCALTRLWRRELKWLQAGFQPVGFCSSKYGQPHEHSYVNIYKKDKGPVFQIVGIFSGGLDPRDNVVRATTSFSRISKTPIAGGKAEVIVRLSRESTPDNWETIQEDRFTVTSEERKTWEMARRDILPGTVIRFDMAVAQDGFEHIRLYDARLYGAQCYPDFAQPENCL